MPPSLLTRTAAFLLLALGAGACPACLAEEPTKKDVATTDPAPTPDTTERLLTLIEDASRKVGTLETRLRYSVKQTFGEQVRFGVLRAAAAKPAAGNQPALPQRVHVHFNNLIVDGNTEAQNQHLIFDGTWLLETDDRARTATRRKIQGQGGHPLASVLPMILPFDRAALLKDYEVTGSQMVSLPGPREEGEIKAVRLLLAPKAKNARVTGLQLDFRADTLLPLALRFSENDEETELLLTKAAANPSLPADCFDTTPPTDPAWKVQVQQ